MTNHAFELKQGDVPPVEIVAQMRQAPFSAGMEGAADTLVYDAAV